MVLIYKKFDFINLDIGKYQLLMILLLVVIIIFIIIIIIIIFIIFIITNHYIIVIIIIIIFILLYIKLDVDILCPICLLFYIHIIHIHVFPLFSNLHQTECSSFI